MIAENETSSFKLRLIFFHEKLTGEEVIECVGKIKNLLSEISTAEFRDAEIINYKFENFSLLFDASTLFNFDAATQEFAKLEDFLSFDSNDRNILTIIYLAETASQQSEANFDLLAKNADFIKIYANKAVKRCFEEVTIDVRKPQSEDESDNNSDFIRLKKQILAILKCQDSIIQFENNLKKFFKNRWKEQKSRYWVNSLVNQYLKKFKKDKIYVKKLEEILTNYRSLTNSIKNKILANLFRKEIKTKIQKDEIEEKSPEIKVSPTSKQADYIRKCVRPIYETMLKKKEESLEETLHKFEANYGRTTPRGAKTYNLLELNYEELKYYIDRGTKTYKYGDPNSLLQFGYSNNIHYAVGLDSLFAITNSIFEIEEIVELSQDKFPMASSETPANLIRIVDNWSILFQYGSLLGTYNFKTKHLKKFGQHDYLSDAIKLQSYKNTIVSGNLLNTLKFWNYENLKMVKLVKNNPSYFFEISCLLSVKEYLFVGGCGCLRVFSVKENKFLAYNYIGKNTFLALAELEAFNNNSRQIFFLGLLDSFDLVIYSFKIDNRNQVDIIEEQKGIFDLRLKEQLPYKILVSDRQVFINGFESIKIFSLSCKKQDNLLTPRLQELTQVNFTSPIYFFFKVEETIFVFGRDPLRVRSIFDINEVLDETPEEKEKEDSILKFAESIKKSHTKSVK